MGKSAIDESHSLFSGVYIGSVSIPAVQELVDTADLTISIGGLQSDCTRIAQAFRKNLAHVYLTVNTGSFSYTIREDQHIELHSHSTKIQYANYADLGFHVALPKLIAALKGVKPKSSFKPLTVDQWTASATPNALQKAKIEQVDFWPTVATGLRENVHFIEISLRRN